MHQMFTVGCLIKEDNMSKISEIIKKLVLKPFKGKQGTASAKKPDPLPPPDKPTNDD